MTKVVLTMLIILSFALPVGGATGKGETEKGSVTPEPTWWKDKRRGWYWKEDPKEKKTKETEVKKEQYISVLKRYNLEELWNMHPDEYSKIMKEALHRAVQTLDVGDVREYLILQDIAARKSRAYAAVVDYVVTTDPILNMTKDFPITYEGRVAYLKQAASVQENYITQKGENHAILYFAKEGCPYCTAMDNVLSMFKKRYPGWIVKKLDINYYPALAEKFGITVTPTLILIKRGSQDWMPVSYGAISLSELEASLYRALRFLNKEITPSEWWTMEHEKGGSFDPFFYIDTAKKGENKP